MYRFLPLFQPFFRDQIIVSYFIRITYDEYPLRLSKKAAAVFETFRDTPLNEYKEFLSIIDLIRNFDSDAVRFGPGSSRQKELRPNDLAHLDSKFSIRFLFGLTFDLLPIP